MSDELRKSNLHEDSVFKAFAEKGGLFDVGPNELDYDIGRRVRFSDAEEGTYYAHEYVIVAVQYDYKGDLTYRVQLAEDAPRPRYGRGGSRKGRYARGGRRRRQ